MILLGFLLTCLMAISAQVRPTDPRIDRSRGQDWNGMPRQVSPSNVVAGTNKGDIVKVENKNVNLIVNVDPKDVAKELYKLIENRIDPGTGRRAPINRETIEELEKIVGPVVSPTRRSHRPSAFEIAYSLDHVTRKAILGDHLTDPTIDDEIVTRDIVADMMQKLKVISDQENRRNEKLYRTHDASRRSMQVSVDDDRDDNDDDTISVTVKILRSELAKKCSLISNKDY